MPNKNIHVRYDATGYGALAVMSPVEDLPSAAVRRRDRAVECLERTPDSAVLAVAPESTATGYRLANTPLTVVRLSELPTGTYDELASRVGEELSKYRVLAWGRPARRENRTLREYV